QEGRFGRVADRDRDIAHEAVAADALYRRAREARPEGTIVETREFGQRRRLEIGAGGELRLACALRELVPGAYGKAIVAAIDAVAHRLSERARHGALVLDRQVGDAALRIEPVG